ncbi:MAG: winged helix-turn-helix domain-containing protein [Candidatus Thermoplasmatota archaeon]|nr:winged helix-turn-helix domain-containing protein [Candidatus Thermoplasmatota archaeon]
MGARQCQRIFRKLGFRIGKPRPVIAKADEEKKDNFKKTMENGA